MPKKSEKISEEPVIEAEEPELTSEEAVIHPPTGYVHYEEPEQK